MSFTIRPVTVYDSDEILSVYAPYITDTVLTFEYEVPTKEAFRRRVESVLECYPYLAAVEDGRIIGYAYAHRARERKAYDWYAELSVYTRQGCSKKGVGTALYSALIEILKLQNIQVITAVISAPNPPSEALHKKVGFVQSGLHPRTGFKHGQWRDTLCMDLPVTERDAPPAPFVPFPDTDMDTVLGICRKYSI
ncbi:MAG: N-acetyltransferase [Ruminococcaceae bacterium]|nr:N-acetyltransferase [Oscillospiraceae bacterium]